MNNLISGTFIIALFSLSFSTGFAAQPMADDKGSVVNKTGCAECDVTTKRAVDSGLNEPKNPNRYDAFLADGGSRMAPSAPAQGGNGTDHEGP